MTNLACGEKAYIFNLYNDMTLVTRIVRTNKQKKTDAKICKIIQLFSIQSVQMLQNIFKHLILEIKEFVLSVPVKRIATLATVPKRLPDKVCCVFLESVA